MEWQPDSTQNFTYSRLQEVKLKLLPKTPQKGGVSLYPVHFICCLPAARCGWPFPLLSTLVSCIQPVVYQHHGVFSAQLSSTLLSCSSHWCEQVSATGASLCTGLYSNWVSARWGPGSHPIPPAWVASLLPPAGCCLCTSEGTFYPLCQVGDEEAKQYLIPVLALRNAAHSWFAS